MKPNSLLLMLKSNTVFRNEDTGNKNKTFFFLLYKTNKYRHIPILYDITHIPTTLIHLPLYNTFFYEHSKN